MANPTSRPRSTAKAKPTHVDLDLDTLVIESEEIEPFTVKVGGKVITMISPKKIDWQIAVAIANNQSPHLLFSNVLDEKDREHFFKQAIDVEKMEFLSQQYREHFHLDEVVAGN